MLAAFSLPRPKLPRPSLPESSRTVASAPGVLQEFVSDLESSLGDSFLPGAVPHEPTHSAEPVSAYAAQPEPASQPELEPVGNATPTTFGVPQNEVIGEFVADLEASLGDDFLKMLPSPNQFTHLKSPLPTSSAIRPGSQAAIRDSARAAMARVRSGTRFTSRERSRSRQRRGRFGILRCPCDFVTSLSPSRTAIGCHVASVAPVPAIIPSVRPLPPVFTLRRRCRRRFGRDVR